MGNGGVVGCAGSTGDEPCVDEAGSVTVAEAALRRSGTVDDRRGAATLDGTLVGSSTHSMSSSASMTSADALKYLKSTVTSTMPDQPLSQPLSYLMSYLNSSVKSVLTTSNSGN